MIFFKHYYFISEGKWRKSIGEHSISLFRLPKLKLTLKLALLIASLTCFKVSAMANTLQINLKLKNVSLETAFNEIKKQTGYGFWYDKQDFNNAAKISINVKNAGLKETLDHCFKNQPYTYEIFDKTIVVKRKAKDNGNQINNEIDLNINGKVINGNGLPMSGVSVKLIGTNKVTITDKDGQFSIAVPDENAVLLFTYMGFAAIEHTIDKDRFLNIVLKEELNTLESVEINAGYYTVKDREKTGSISRVDAKTIEKQPISNPLQALQGRVPGMEISQLTGVPGGGFSVQIRGRNSISNGNDPLYIVDGVIYPSIKLSGNILDPITAGVSPLSMVNPNDILSIEILKDADATAIYGSRGANGVILITSKSGKNGSSKVNVSISNGFSQVSNKLDLLNTSQYIDMRKEAFKNDGVTPDGLQYDINGTWDQNKYTDWQKQLIGGTANTTSSSLSISGGNKNSSYLVSGNYYGEGTVFPGDFGFRRGGLHSNLNVGSVDDKFNIKLTAIYNHSKSTLLNSDLTLNILLSPNMPDSYDEYGKLNWAQNTVFLNPMALLLRTNTAVTDNLIGNINASYRIAKNLIIRASLGYNNIKREELAKAPLASNSPAFGFTASDRVSYFSNNSNENWIAEPLVNYTTKLGLGNLDVLVGMSFQNSTNQYRTIKASGYNSDELMESISNATLFSNHQMNNSQYRYIAGFARLNYNILNKYYINLTGRRDGSSRFGSGKQFANFGAIGASWIISEEKFIRNLPIISFAKLRASYGITGNDQIKDYGYLQLWTGSGSIPYQGTSTIFSTGISNPDFAWETNKKAEASLELGFLKDKINVEISFYRNRSSNQLVGIPLPPSTGNVAIQANLPATVQNTGWEFETNFKIHNKNNWNWSTGINLTIPKNKLIDYPGLANSTNAANYIIGFPLSIRKVYNTSVDSQTGLYVREDFDKNGSFNINDRYLNSFIGTLFYGGLQNSIRFKRFNLDFLFAFTKQMGNNYMAGISNTPGKWQRNSPFGNQPSFVLDRWKSPDDNVNTQKFSTLSAASSAYLTARGDGGLSIDDASFARLKNISFSYQLPNDWLSKAKISNVEINFQGQNVFTLTKYKGLDPESQTLSNLPPLRTFLIGLKLSL